jgi:hypothetical protein
MIKPIPAWAHALYEVVNERASFDSTDTVRPIDRSLAGLTASSLAWTAGLPEASMLHDDSLVRSGHCAAWWRLVLVRSRLFARFNFRKTFCNQPQPRNLGDDLQHSHILLGKRAVGISPNL